MTKQIDNMSPEEFDEYFDEGGDVSSLFESAQEIKRPNCETKQISVSIPIWLVEFLDDESARRGIARKAVINTALVEWCDEQRERARRISA